MTQSVSLPPLSTVLLDRMDFERKILSTLSEEYARHVIKNYCMVDLGKSYGWSRRVALIKSLIYARKKRRT